MIACFDVAYSDPPKPIAVAACLVFESWTSSTSVAQYVSVSHEVADYVPGEFYKRELSPILGVLNQITESIDTFIVDGYVQLSSSKAGLGQILFERLKSDSQNQEPENGSTSIAVVGVAKKNFAENDVSVEICRGESDRPLFVTAIGMPIEDAAKKVKQMHGAFRMPTLLKQVDGLVRQELEKQIDKANIDPR